MNFFQNKIIIDFPYKVPHISETFVMNENSTYKVWMRIQTFKRKYQVLVTNLVHRLKWCLSDFLSLMLFFFMDKFWNDFATKKSFSFSLKFSNLAMNSENGYANKGWELNSWNLKIIVMLKCHLIFLFASFICWWNFYNVWKVNIQSMKENFNY